MEMQEGAQNTMTTTKTTKKSAWQPWHGFAIEIGPDTELSEGILMQELVVPGQSIPYNRPVGAVVSVNEAREIAASRKNNESCTYRVWARGVEGELIPLPAEILVVKK
jgi:hypothetical protein